VFYCTYMVISSARALIRTQEGLQGIQGDNPGSNRIGEEMSGVYVIQKSFLLFVLYWSSFF